MRKDVGIANYKKDQLFGGGCAKETAITEMAQSLEGSHARRHQACSRKLSRAEWQEKVHNVSARYDERSFGSRQGEGTWQPSVSLPWKKPKAFWNAGEESWWQTGVQEKEGNEEVWKRSRSWKGAWHQKDGSRQEGTCAIGLCLDGWEGSSSSDGWARTSGLKRSVEERELKRSASEEDRSYINEMITEEEVEE